MGRYLYCYNLRGFVYIPLISAVINTNTVYTIAEYMLQTRELNEIFRTPCSMT